jgi:hypothetical protein
MQAMLIFITYLLVCQITPFSQRIIYYNMAKQNIGLINMNNPIISNPYHNRVDTPKYEHYFDRSGSINRFVKLLEGRGFIVQKGSIIAKCVTH